MKVTYWLQIILLAKVQVYLKIYFSGLQICITVKFKSFATNLFFYILHFYLNSTFTYSKLLLYLQHMLVNLKILFTVQ